MLIEAREGSVEPDYGQFYLRTRQGERASDTVSGWGYEAHLEASSPGFIYIGTLKQFFTTPVRVEVHDSEPDPPAAKWQHVVEVSFAGDGILEVLSWPGDFAFSVPTPDGPLRLRAKWAGLEPGLEEGLREGGTSDEHLQLEIWSAPPADRKVVRWWPEWDLPPPSPTAPDGRRQIEGVDEVMAFAKSRLRLVPRDLVGAPALLGGQSGYCSLIWGDPSDGSWWVDGDDVRRTLGTASEDEVRELLRHSKPTNLQWFRLPPDPRWTAMLDRIGVREP